MRKSFSAGNVKPSATPLRIVCISDTHNCDLPLDLFPDGDLLIHAGDHTVEGEPNELKAASAWLRSVLALKKYKYGIVSVSGNHDAPMELDSWRAVHGDEVANQSEAELLEMFHRPDEGLHWLRHEAIEIAGLRIFGSPYVGMTPSRKNLAEDNPKRYIGGIRTEEKLEALYAQIPPNVDILITHGPPNGILDASVQYGGVPREQPVNIGSRSLTEWLERRTKAGDAPMLHVFGHEHDSRGSTLKDGTIFVNAACVDGDRGTKDKGGYTIKPDLQLQTVELTPRK